MTEADRLVAFNEAWGEHWDRISTLDHDAETIHRATSILHSLAKLTPTEAEAAVRMFARFADGAETYGHYDPRTDKRSMVREAAAESADFCVYRAMDWLALVTSRLDFETVDTARPAPQGA